MRLYKIYQRAKSEQKLYNFDMNLGEARYGSSFTLQKKNDLAWMYLHTFQQNSHKKKRKDIKKTFVHFQF